MPDAVIQVQAVSKRYQIGAGRKDMTIRDAVAAVPRKVLSRIQGGHARSEDFWALRDVSFEVEQGSVLGLVGRNGAGKSTMLKILSRIVEPTSGRAVLDGRTASLLEVGTGFHAELTGRDNVYLNGAILGMRRREIEAKFDEIVEFSGIEQFLDTPVKFYSSGMYVRLAFAVAAHLDPDILLVDEVLAVGDSEFQTKSLGKMSAVARSGRTVVFVSHNSSALLDLCDRGVLLERGRLARAGAIEEVMAAYEGAGVSRDSGLFRRGKFDSATNVFVSARLSGTDGSTQGRFDYGSTLFVRVETNPTLRQHFGLELRFRNFRSRPIAYAGSWIASSERFQPGDVIEVTVPALPLMEGTYYIDLIARIPGGPHFDTWANEVHFGVANAKPGAFPIHLRASDELGAVVLEDASFTTC